MKLYFCQSNSQALKQTNHTSSHAEGFYELLRNIPMTILTE